MDDSSSVTEILEESVDEQEIIVEQEGECEEAEIEEIIEIIEEIEEVDDDLEQIETIDDEDEPLHQVEKIKKTELSGKSNGLHESPENLDDYDDKEVVYIGSSEKSRNSRAEKPSSHICYDASVDWEDEEYEQEQQNSVENAELSAANSGDMSDYGSYNNGVMSAMEVVKPEDQEDVRTEISRTQQMNYEESASQEVISVDTDDNNEQEIVESSENNLVYTVLGSKKPMKSGEENRSDVEYVEIQRYREDNMTEDATVYYAVNDGDGSYVLTTVEDEEQEQYQYVNEEPMEQDNQDWEEESSQIEAGEDQQDQIEQEQDPDQDQDQDQDQEQEQEQEQELELEQEQEQEQIYLHEDTDGQLYFKNEHGQLQPVYMTADGNYAIAENSSDEMESQGDGVNQVLREEDPEPDQYILPDHVEMKQFNSKKMEQQQQQQQQQQHAEVDNDDSTVTISLIISEDENGQKRTQVIIPTPAESKCDICNKSFKTSLQLLKHNRLKHAKEEDITTRNFPCDMCPKRFSDQNSLARHRKTHTESRLFQCLECHKSFPTANTLREHLSLHNPDSLPLPCIYCGRRFSDKVSLTKHEQSHLAGEKRSHVCDICQKCFSNVTDLNIHKKYHDPDRKFDCEVCGREFNRLNNLQRHMMVHQQQETNEEILSCNVCGITYKFSSSLTRHMVTRHMNPEKLRQQAEEQRRKRENNYRRYLENRKTFENQQPKRPYRRSMGKLMDDKDDEADCFEDSQYND